MNLMIFIILVAIGTYIFLRFTKKGKQMHILQNPQELLLNIHEEVNEELNSFISKHDFSIYTPNVGVFGENSTGKSTFLNAMLGNKDQFKMGFGETTNKITILYKNAKPIVESGFGSIHNNITYEYTKSNYKHLAYMNLFDIPGFGQQFSEDALKTVVKKMDIVFWFIDASKGIKKEDRHFLENIKGLDTKVIIVLNKVDTITENDDIKILQKEISNEILKIKTFFKEEFLEKNLVSVFPFSATKSLVGSVRKQNGAYKVIDNIVQNILLYTVFIESYRGYIEYYFDYEDEIDLYEFYENIDEIAKGVCVDLEFELKENISIWNSTFGTSKDKVAKPIVHKYINSLKNKINYSTEEFQETVNEQIESSLEDLGSFDAFGQTSVFDFELEKMPYINIDIDLNSMAWNSFRGNSFSEDVTNKFEKKVMKKIDRQIPEILQEYENAINDFKMELINNTYDFANTLDKKVSTITTKIQEPLLMLLLKAVHNKLDEKDNEYIGKMLKI